MSTGTGHATAPRALLLVLAIAGCGLGLFAALILDGEARSERPGDTPTQRPAHTVLVTPAENPFGVLLIMLDRASGAAALRGAWLFYVMPNTQQIYLEGMPNDLLCVAADGTPARLDSAYNESAGDEAVADAAVRDMARRVFHYQSVDYLIALDGAGLDAVAARIGPLNIAGAPLGTPPSALWNDPAGSGASLVRQESILEGIIAALSRSKSDSFAESLYASVRRSGRTDLAPEQFYQTLLYLADYGTDPQRHTFLRLDPGRQYCQP